MQNTNKQSLENIIMQLEDEINNPPEEKLLQTLYVDIADLKYRKKSMGFFNLLKKFSIQKKINLKNSEIETVKYKIKINKYTKQKELIKLKLDKGILKRLDTITFGNYQGDIEWLILGKSKGKLLLISKYIITCMPYHTVLANIAWDNSFIRSWLNNTFMNHAFNCEQQKDICYTNVTPDGSYRPRAQGPIIENRFQGEYTRDKIFLLSAEEAQKYFNSGAERCATKTSYAEQKAPTAKANYWWLRTVWTLYHTNNPNPPLSANAWAVCGNSESVDAGIITDGFPMNFDGVGIRPAIWLSLED